MKHVSVIHGDNDPVVPYSNAEFISKRLGCRLVTIPNGKHLGGSAGFVTLPEVLTELMSMMNA